jgi:hypothetical protein
VTKSGPGAFQECLRASRHPQCVGAHNTHVPRVHFAQSLPEPVQAGQGAVCRIAIEPAVLAYAAAKAHHLTQPVNDDELAVRITRHYHMKAVRT